MAKNEIRLPGRMFRQGIIVRAQTGDSEEVPQSVALSFSSEEPVERYFGFEVLGHNSGEVDASFMESGRAPLLVDHRASVEHQIGIVESVSFSGGKGRAEARFGKSGKAQEIAKRVADGEIVNVSVGYRVNAIELAKDGKDDLPTYRVTDWTPFEISLVSVPADPSVGLGRARPEEGGEITLQLSRKERPMAAETETRSEDPNTHEDTQRTVDQVRAEEQTRIREIEAVGARFNCRDKAQAAIKNGESADQFRGAVLMSLGEQGQERISAAADIGLSPKERKAFSFVRALHALANPNDQGAQEAAAFERECSAVAAKKRGKEQGGILVPADVMRTGMGGQTRSLNTGVAAEGGALVGTDLLAGSFIDLLRARAVVLKMGARMLNDLQGNIAIPRLTGGATAYWVGEDGDVPESQQAVDQVTMTPHTLGGHTKYSRKLLLQSSLDVEAMVRDDLAKVLGLEISRAALHGSGAGNQPQGISSLTGVNSTTFAAALPTWGEVVAMETAVATDEADIGALGYIINPAMRGGFKTTEKAVGTARFIWEDGGTVNGYHTGVTTQILTDNAFFGNWEDLLIGAWSGVDLTVDPYTNAQSGNVRVIALQDVDIAGRHPGSFCHSYYTA
ncbi:phage major capsid protein [Roseibium polysiphoniae]|uniref:Phage major capsid protein n=1 Tax=Roseibium polysiphoniae TaxID=2571221 RepID=A0ABR9C6B2_9HYPH|nr:phage major capsid protein [Roseibium polysiphoniae]MBD8875430.1 phage major capsid protein [Roseibium polysiphoniae]